MKTAKLALGTVQFGLAYGVAGRTAAVPEHEVRDILARAWAAGVTRLDTAPGYGDIEERLGALCGNTPFEIVTKIPALPHGLCEADARYFVTMSIEKSRERLGDRICGLLFHRADDLVETHGAAIWDAAQASGFPLGPSCYDAQTLAGLCERLPVKMAQVPGNALDQGVARPMRSDVEISLRSAFLQGLLLMPQCEAASRVPAAAGALARWHAHVERSGQSPLSAALSIVKGFGTVDYCVVGVDNADHFDAIADAWRDATAARQDDLASSDRTAVDPRLWTVV